MSFLEVRGLSQSFENYTAYSGVDFSLEKGDFLCVIGPSGCGKTTLLRAVGGFLRPSAGGVFIGGREVLEPASECSMVFQSFDQLFPWKTVLGNVAFPLAAAKKYPTRRECEQAARKYLAMTGLAEFEGRRPHQLSGGMKQRAAIARALSLEKPVMLMDEPFASLDADSRTRLQKELKQLWDEMGLTVLFVTHSIIEAVSLGTKIMVMGAGEPSVRLFCENPVAPDPDAHGMRSPQSPGYSEFWGRLNAMIRGK